MGSFARCSRSLRYSGKKRRLHRLHKKQLAALCLTQHHVQFPLVEHGRFFTENMLACPQGSTGIVKVTVRVRADIDRIRVSAEHLGKIGKGTASKAGSKCGRSRGAASQNPRTKRYPERSPEPSRSAAKHRLRQSLPNEFPNPSPAWPGLHDLQALTEDSGLVRKE